MQKSFQPTSQYCLVCQEELPLGNVKFCCREHYREYVRNKDQYLSHNVPFSRGRNASTRGKFVKFMATPNDLRVQQFGYKLKKDFAKDHGLSRRTLSRWLEEKSFREKIEERRRLLGLNKTSEVIGALLENIKRNGRASEVRLWLEFFEGLGEKSKTTSKVDSLTNFFKE